MGLELRALLPEAPPGFRNYAAGVRRLWPIRWVLLRLFSRLTGTARTIWLSDGSDGKPYLIELLADVYAGPRYAARMRAGNLPDAQTITRLIDPSPTIVTSPVGRLVMQWQRGSLLFIEFSAVHSNAVIGALAVSGEGVDAGSLLSDLLDDIQVGLDARGLPASGAIPPRAWAWLVALPLGFVAGILTALVGTAVGESVGRAMFAVIAGVTVFSLSIWPRVLRRRSRLERIWRLGLTQGDSDGTIRRALASIGINLPEATPPAP